MARKIWNYVCELADVGSALTPVAKVSAPSTILVKHLDTLPVTMEEYCCQSYKASNWDAIYFTNEQREEFMCLVIFIQEGDGSIETYYQLYRHEYHTVWHYRGNYDDVSDGFTSVRENHTASTTILNICNATEEDVEPKYMTFQEYYPSNNKKIYFQDRDQNYWMVVTNGDSLDAYQLG